MTAGESLSFFFQFLRLILAWMAVQVTKLLVLAILLTNIPEVFAFVFTGVMGDAGFWLNTSVAAVGTWIVFYLVLTLVRRSDPNRVWILRQVAFVMGSRWVLVVLSDITPEDHWINEPPTWLWVATVPFALGGS